MESEQTLQALVTIWHRLPKLLGYRWGEFYRSVSPHLEALSRCPAADPDRERLTALTVLLFRPYSEAREQLRIARQELGFRTETRTTSPEPSKEPQPSWQSLQSTIDAVLNPPPIHRTIRGIAPRRLPAGKESTLSIRIEGASVDQGSQLILQPFRPLTLQLWRLGGDLEIADAVQHISNFEADGQTVDFGIVGRTLGSAHLSVEFFQDHLHLGHLPIHLRIVGSGEPEQRRELPPNRLWASGPYEPAADIELHVRTVRGENPSLSYMLRSQQGQDFDPVGSVPLPPGSPQRIESEIAGTLKSLGHEPESRIDGVLSKLGHWLYHHITSDHLNDALQHLPPEARQLHIVSDEPWIPWEMVKPIDTATGWRTDFLCAQYQLTRWLTNSWPPSRRLQLSDWVCMSSPSDKESVLDRNYLEAWSGVEPFANVPLEQSDTTAALDLLAQGRGDLWHFAIRGSDTSQGETIPLVVGDHAHIVPRDLFDLDPSNSHRPTVFLNVHHAARQQLILKNLEGWPSAWIQQAGCGALLAPRWQVDSRAAHLFAQHFYDHLRSGKPFGRALFDARRQLRKHPDKAATWLAFAGYAHANARSSLHGSEGGRPMTDG